MGYGWEQWHRGCHSCLAGLSGDADFDAPGVIHGWNGLARFARGR